MILQTFIQKLNWRQILLHFVATFFLLLACQQFAFLTNTEKYEASQMLISSSNKRLTTFLENKNVTLGQLMIYIFYSRAAWMIGLIIAFIISLSISKRKKWFWFNSFVVLIIAFVMGKQDFLEWAYLRKIFLAPGLMFNGYFLYLLTNGLVLLSLGMFTFFYSRFNDFIESKKLAAAIQ